MNKRRATGLHGILNVTLYDTMKGFFHEASCFCQAARESKRANLAGRVG